MVNSSAFDSRQQKSRTIARRAKIFVNATETDHMAAAGWQLTTYSQSAGFELIQAASVAGSREAVFTRRSQRSYQKSADFVRCSSHIEVTLIYSVLAVEDLLRCTNG
mmetsp:Transcript_13601/g.26241  ORF Transcript_13601/g.26241 Transcript_13601/m.26241 type:complete len:107 (-) Transcript_13601:178-498(-)